MDNTEIERRSCGFCGVEIPQARLKALPDTRICVKCSQGKGAEFELRSRPTAPARPAASNEPGKMLKFVESPSS